jgi:ketosteroid isomerase-like protein
MPIRSNDAEIAAVLATEDRRRAALVELDLATLDHLFADDLVHIHSTGLRHGKPALLAHIERRRAFLAITRGRLDVRIEGDLAVVVGPIANRMRTEEGGETMLLGIATQVLRREPAGWRFIGFQLTPDLETPASGPGSGPGDATKGGSA